MLSIKTFLIASAFIIFAHTAKSENSFSYIPEIHGTLRAKYELSTQTGKNRFEVRNARISVTGKILPIISYRMEADLCDEGAIKMLDAYMRAQPGYDLKFTIGQMRVPFTIDAHRGPHMQYFANRSFIAKQVGNVRDVGASIGWSYGEKTPIVLEAGIFNGSGLVKQKDYWTSSLNYSAKVQAFLMRHINVTLSVQKATLGQVNVFMYDAGCYFESDKWHIEAEYLRKHYKADAYNPVNAFNAFTAYRIPLSKKISSISFLGRYDYMSNHSKGNYNESGLLTTDDPTRHRITCGITLSLGKSKLQADVRLNYEQYLYENKSVITNISEQNKIVAEFVCRF